MTPSRMRLNRSSFEVDPRLALGALGLVVAAFLGGACGSTGGKATDPAIWERAEAATLREDWPRAVELWNTIRVQERPPSVRAERETAVALARVGRGEDAVALLDRALIQFPEEWTLLKARGRILADLGFRRAAEGDLAAAVGSAPGDFETWLLLGRIRLELDSPSRARAALERAVELEPSHREALVLSARALRALGQSRAAHERYARALSGGGRRDVDLLLEAASLHASPTADVRDLGVDAALGWIQEAIELDPQDPQVAFVQGVLLERAGDAPGASLAYRRAIEVDNFHLAAMTNLAVLYDRRGESGKAAEIAERILMLDLEQDRQRRAALRAIVDRGRP